MDIQHKETFWQSFGVYLDLGFVNMAEHLLTESLEGLGDRPMVLQQLAWINMIKDNTGTARIYLGKLSQTLFHGQWARDYLDLLDRDPNLSTDEAIQNARAMALDKDIGFSVVSEDLVCQWLLEKNPTNRMAFEYLMASYLIEGQLKEFASWIQKCRQFGYKRMPRHFEEGALVYAVATKKDFYLGGYTPSNEIRRRLEDFGKIMQRYHGNARAAYSEMAKRHAGSYFFYNTYSRLGQGR